MPKSQRNRRRTTNYRPMHETSDLVLARVHITKAGHEILLAAEGLFNFCKAYVEQKSTEKPYRNWIRYISRQISFLKGSKAFTMVTDLSSNMLRAAPIKHAAEKFSNFRM